MALDPNELGALWIKHGKKGDYLTGTINGIKVVAFANTKKTKDTQPDWRVLKSVPRVEGGAPQNNTPDDF